LRRASDAAQRAYRLGTGLAVAALLLALAVVGAALSRLSFDGGPAHEASLAGVHVALPDANPAAIALLALATIGVGVVLALLRGVWVIGRSHRRLQRGLPVAGPLPGAPDVTVFQHDRVMAFCAGLLRPRVYVSAGALRELGEDELRAVLAHERRHRARRDPLRLVTARLLGEALFFAPAVRTLARRYDTLAELAADDHALAAVGGDASVLASAMLAFDAGVAPERADHALGLRGDWALPLGLSAMTATGIAGMALLVWQLGHHAVLRTALVSPAPCVIVLALVPLSAVALGMWASRRF
jgi:Zn-dependent protease with chaperone function